MKSIRLSDHGNLFSGRSRARDLVEMSIIDEGCDSIAIDFSGASLISQSFVSELIMELYKKKSIHPEKIIFESIDDEVVKKRIDTEIKRISDFLASS